MKNKRALLMLFCFIFCLSIINPIQAESALTAKQLLLNSLQKSTFSLPTGLFERVSSTTTLILKKFSGSLVYDSEQLKDLEGSELKYDYKLNSPEKKMEIDYNLTYHQKNFTCSEFIDKNKIIMSTEILSLLKEIDPSFNSDSQTNIPKYIYFNDNNYKYYWNFLDNCKKDCLPPGVKDLLAFMIEAVPDKYFSASLVSQKVTFCIDQQGLCDVIFSLMQKTMNEKERFASDIADIAIACDPEADHEKIKSEIIADINKSVSKGDYPESSEEIQQELAGIIDLDELKYEVSLLSAGQRKLAAVMDFWVDSELTGRLTVNTDSTGSLENLSGTYFISLTARDTEDINVACQMNGRLQQTGSDVKSNFNIEANVKDMSKYTSLLDFDLEGSSTYNADEDVQINIPELAKSNSLDIGPYLNKTSKSKNNSPKIHVLVDGRPIAFDIPPCDEEGRTMVPVRNLAKALGCEVAWVDPDQINLCREDISITMYIGQQTYTVNGEEKQFDVPPFIKNDTVTMVPLRTIAEELGCQVKYDAASKTILIRQNNNLEKQAGPVFSQGPASSDL